MSVCLTSFILFLIFGVQQNKKTDEGEQMSTELNFWMISSSNEKVNNYPLAPTFK